MNKIIIYNFKVNKYSTFWPNQPATLNVIIINEKKKKKEMKLKH